MFYTQGSFHYTVVSLNGISEQGIFRKGRVQEKAEYITQFKYLLKLFYQENIWVISCWNSNIEEEIAVNRWQSICVESRTPGVLESDSFTMSLHWRLEGTVPPPSPREVSPCFWLYHCVSMLLGYVEGVEGLVGVFLLILNFWPPSLNTMIFLVGLIYSIAYTFKSTWMTLFLALRSLSLLYQTTHKQNIHIHHLSPHSSFLSRVLMVNGTSHISPEQNCIKSCLYCYWFHLIGKS